MTTNERFEQTLASGLAELGRADATNLVADVLAATARTRQRRAWTGLEWWIGPRGRVAGGRLGVRWIVVAVLMAIVVAAVAVGVGSRVTPRPTVVSPTIVPRTDASPRILSTEGFPTALAGMWVADQPPRMSFGMPFGLERMTLNLGPSSTFLSDNRKIGWMSADGSATTATVNLVTRVEVSDSSFGRNLPLDGVSVPTEGSDQNQLLGACRTGDLGIYRWLVFPEGIGTLSLTKVADDCPGRPAILENTVWVRAERAELIGPIRVDAVTPAFSVSLPAEAYDVSSSPGVYEAIAPDKAVRFSVFQDPHVLRNGCDARAGMIELGAGTENLIGALEQRPELTVTLEPGRHVGGVSATVASVQARANDGCVGDQIRAWWLPLGEGGRIWSVDPGWIARLVFVDVGGHTLMFDIEPSSPEVEPGKQILDSVVFQP